LVQKYLECCGSKILEMGATEMARSRRKVDPVKVFRQPDAAIGSHQTAPTQLIDDQIDGPEDDIPVPSVAESPVLCELTNTSDVVPPRAGWGSTSGATYDLRSNCTEHLHQLGQYMSCHWGTRRCAEHLHMWLFRSRDLRPTWNCRRFRQQCYATSPVCSRTPSPRMREC